MIHQANDVLAHRFAHVCLRVVRLSALAMTAAIKCDDVVVRPEMIEPLRTPVVIGSRRKAVDQHNGLALAVFLEINLHAVRIEVGHR